MPFRIEKIVDGKVVQRADRNKNGLYQCHPPRTNMQPIEFQTIKEAAAYLQDVAGSGIRMNPNWSLIIDDIHIDGKPR
jgi:hypothetical protein